ncbi:unnamed protein product [Brassica rapa]|uniref:Secreted protein n=1 Tax=Brassica campestris TaxID=3711 RepID=A0A8D9DGT5_BRACM|nr:unnamed protein product [Brassica rapa]
MLICVVSVLIYVLIGNSPRGPKSPEQSTGRVSVLSPRTNVLTCVLMDSHGHPVCADGHTRTHTDSHGRPVCADGHTRTSCPHTSSLCWRTPTDVLCVLNRQPTWAKITRTVHGKGQRAESKDQRADMCTYGQPRTSCVPRGPKSPKQSTERASVMICVLMDSHRRRDQRADMCTYGHPRTSCVCLRTHTYTHGQPRTSCVC